MTKGDKRRGNREAKKPKKTKEKALATTESTKGKVAISIGDKKVS